MTGREKEVVAFPKSSASDDATPAGAVGAEWESEPFLEWASRHRLRAARDGAWKVEVTERLVCGAPLRSVTSWHGTAKQQHAPSRRTQQHDSKVPARSKQQSMRSASDQLHPQRLTSRQQRSALRSAAHHRLRRLRVLRRVWLAVRFLVRLSRLTVGAHAIRDVSSTGKRRHSPPPDVQQHHLHHPLLDLSGEGHDAASPPPPKRAEVGRLVWAREAISRAVFGDG